MTRSVGAGQCNGSGHQPSGSIAQRTVPTTVGPRSKLARLEPEGDVRVQEHSGQDKWSTFRRGHVANPAHAVVLSGGTRAVETKQADDLDVLEPQDAFQRSFKTGLHVAEMEWPGGEEDGDATLRGVPIRTKLPDAPGKTFQTDPPGHHGRRQRDTERFAHVVTRTVIDHLSSHSRGKAHIDRCSILVRCSTDLLETPVRPGCLPRHPRRPLSSSLELSRASASLLPGPRHLAPATSISTEKVPLPRRLQDRAPEGAPRHTTRSSQGRRTATTHGHACGREEVLLVGRRQALGLLVVLSTAPRSTADITFNERQNPGVATSPTSLRRMVQLQHVGGPGHSGHVCPALRPRPRAHHAELSPRPLAKVLQLPEVRLHHAGTGTFLKLHADSMYTHDDISDDPCPVLALARKRPDARTITWC